MKVVTLLSHRDFLLLPPPPQTLTQLRPFTDTKDSGSMPPLRRPMSPLPSTFSSAVSTLTSTQWGVMYMVIGISQPTRKDGRRSTG